MFRKLGLFYLRNVKLEFCENGFSPLCFLIWVVKEKSQNDDLHTLQECGLSLMYILIWVIKADFCENDDPYISLEYGLCPVFILVVKLELFENDDPHNIQEKGFSS